MVVVYLEKWFQPTVNSRLAVLLPFNTTDTLDVLNGILIILLFVMYFESQIFPQIIA